MTFEDQVRNDMFLNKIKDQNTKPISTDFVKKNKKGVNSPQSPRSKYIKEVSIGGSLSPEQANRVIKEVTKKRDH